jgi:hypothetical protein
MTESNEKSTFSTGRSSEKVGKPDESVEAVKDAGGDEVQEKFDEANEKGYFGELQDDTPRENYTLQGVGEGKPTPESDPELRMAWEKNARTF